jgi:5-methyltetrahydrofolate--homocysteine methyltransferase
MNTLSLHRLFDERILVLDGAMGTRIQALALEDEDFGGPAYEGCNEHLVLTRPELIKDIHRSYLACGADIIETNTFGSTDLVLAEYGLENRAAEITRTAARLAREVAEEFSRLDSPRFVAGSMGPTTRAISVTGGVTFEELTATFGRQALALLEGGVDYLLLETCQDTRNIKAALLGIEQAFGHLDSRVPVAVSVTIEPMGTMLAGQTIEALITSLQHTELLYLGLNCATGPEMMTDHLRSLSELAKTRSACVPNAGLPDEEGRYLESPAMMATVLGRFVDEGWVNLLGGCCGTTPEHIRAMVELARGKPSRPVPSYRRTFVSGLENLEIEESNRPVLVGERTNVLGSRLFKKMISEGKFEEAAEVARRQVRNGAQVIDVCLQDPDRDELSDMRRFLDQVTRKIKAPLMIDSTDPAVMEAALTYCQGKAILNSINLEDGEERFRRVVPLARRFGAALIVGAIDEDKQSGMAVSRERKLEIALRAHELLVNQYGVDPADIIFDPLVFPCATGDAAYLGSALETVEGVHLIKQALPDTKTILGISNVSFGLPPAGREIVNSVFLYHCTRAGLDMAIVNSEKIERFASLPDQERELAEAVLFHPGDATLEAFTAYFRDQSSRPRKDPQTLSLDERLSSYIVEGSKDGLIEDLDLKLEEAAPLDIINGPLMSGMEEVGRLFNDNELIVAEVLQSAEAMKAAVAHLEQFLERRESAHRGTVILATVKGDVHDIGKNLVEIILANNGFRVVNLGIKVPPHDLIEAVRRHRPDIVGLSGLLVKSAQQMVVTAAELAESGDCPPLLVGGAALTRNFTRLKIAPAYPGLVAYARDAMDGLDLAGRIADPARRKQLEADLNAERARLESKRPSGEATRVMGHVRSKSVPVLDRVPSPPDFERHILRQVNLDEVWQHLNPVMLYGKHMGLKGRVKERLKEGDEKAQMLTALFEELKQDCRGGAMRIQAVWQFFRAAGEGNSVLLFDPRGQVLERFDFPRQGTGDQLCLSDYLLAPGQAQAPDDSLCLFAVTAGSGIREVYQAFKERGEFLKSHAVQALALETAEAAAEWLHAKLRGIWGFPDSPEISMRDRLHGKYRGRRYSFGYPACPSLEDQFKLWKLIRPEEIGIELTEQCMMEPEASVSAMVFHHPNARYFSVGETEEDREQRESPADERG